MDQQGRYFTLPMPEGAFDDRQGKSDPMNREKKSMRSKKDKLLIHPRNLGLNNGPADFTRREQNAILVNFKNEQMASQNAIKLENAALLSAENSLSDDACEGDVYENYQGCPSKFLLMCLNMIQNDLEHDEAMINERGTPFFALPWGFEFWKHYSNGKNILDTSHAHSTVEQIAWIASTASDTITRREEEGFSTTNPFLLYLVPSQHEAIKSFSSPHDSTPERLTELISLNAIDLSGVSLLVIDGPVYEGGSIDAIKTIRNLIPGSSQALIFGGCLNNLESVSAL
nr:ATP-dependent RNA helicase DBP3 [Ipomoea batatas]